MVKLKNGQLNSSYLRENPQGRFFSPHDLKVTSCPAKEILITLLVDVTL